MGKSPKYVSLEPDAFLSDEDFQIMTAEERGVYITVILYLYRNNGRLKFEEIKLRKLCNVNSEFGFQSVLSKFQVRRGYIRHKRVTKELQRAQVLVDRAINAANARHHKQCSSNAQASAKQCQVKLSKNKVNKEKEYKEKEIFDKARRNYPGTKRGIDTEYNNFQKHSDWKQVLPLLNPAIKQQVKVRADNRAACRFNPPWKNFKTWIYNRCWEETVGVTKTSEEKAKKEKQQIDQEKARLKEEYQEYLESKNTQALKDIKADGGHLVGLCGWIIDEILAKRKGQSKI